jgi:hypothetical protein
MGGALLQKVNRDTQKFAYKCSAVFDGDYWLDVYKDPVTDPGKKSKRGLLDLRRQLRRRLRDRQHPQRLEQRAPHRLRARPITSARPRWPRCASWRSSTWTCRRGRVVKTLKLTDASTGLRTLMDRDGQLRLHRQAGPDDPEVFWELYDAVMGAVKREAHRLSTVAVQPTPHWSPAVGAPCRRVRQHRGLIVAPAY